jgi:hypothetical protein
VATTIDDTTGNTTHASAFNLGLSVCESADINSEAMDKAIAYTSDYIALLTEVQSTTDDLNNASLQKEIDTINAITSNSNGEVSKATSTYNLMSSQASAADQQYTSEESTFNSENSNRADSVNSFNSTIASIMSGLNSLASLLAQ